MKKLLSAAIDRIAGASEGGPPTEPVALPEFRALCHDGAERGPDDLLGQPAVLWFYPKAATAG